MVRNCLWEGSRGFGQVVHESSKAERGLCKERLISCVPILLLDLQNRDSFNDRTFVERRLTDAERIFGCLLFLESQVISTSISTTDMNQFDAGRSPGYDVPVFVEFLKIIGLIKLNIEVKVIYAVVIAVAVRNVPGPSNGTAAIGRSEHIITSERKRITVKMVGFVVTGINKGSDPPGAGLDCVLNITS